MIQHVFQVDGMRCEGCASSVKQAAAAVTGVDSAVVTLADGKLCITGTTFSDDAVIGAVQSAGFCAKRLQEP